jgi:hypothetical protein
VRHYNEVRLHSAIGYVTPAAKLAGRAPTIFAERDRKREAARERRQQARAATRRASDPGKPLLEPFGGATMNDGLGGG